MSLDLNDMLNGIDEIMEFWDPCMTKDYFYRNVRPFLNPILFERLYAKRRKDRLKRYYTYKHLVLFLKLRLEKPIKKQTL